MSGHSTNALRAGGGLVTHERLDLHSAGALADEELLAILVAANRVEAAGALLKEGGIVQQLAHESTGDPARIKGMTPARVAMVVAGGWGTASASAEPMFLSKQYPRCTACHYSPSGGGLLTLAEESAAGAALAEGDTTFTMNGTSTSAPGLVTSSRQHSTANSRPTSTRRRDNPSPAGDRASSGTAGAPCSTDPCRRARGGSAGSCRSARRRPPASRRRANRYFFLGRLPRMTVRERLKTWDKECADLCMRYDHLSLSGDPNFRLLYSSVETLETPGGVMFLGTNPGGDRTRARISHRRLPFGRP